jgi:hypothetical protein
LWGGLGRGYKRQATLLAVDQIPSGPLSLEERAGERGGSGNEFAILSGP